MRIFGEEVGGQMAVPIANNQANAVSWEKKGRALAPFFGAFSFGFAIFFISGILFKFADAKFFIKQDFGLVIIGLALTELIFRGWLWGKIGAVRSLVLFVVVFAIGYSVLFAADIPSLIVFLLLYGGLMMILRAREDCWACALAAMAYFAVVLGHSVNLYSQSIALQLFLLFFPLYLKMRWTGLFGALGKVGIKREGLARNIALGVGATILVFAFMFFVSILLYLTHSNNDLIGVKEKIDSFPKFVVVMAFTFTPIAEEFFFRGLLFPAFGAFASSLLFALSHYSYGSVFEIAMAFLVGCFYCWLYKKTGSLIPPIVSHALFNLVSLSLAGRI
ncbi:MAG: CPBP family intramembrane glutamic endopeptidase [Candidatus Micrarchaeota archaeon]